MSTWQTGDVVVDGVRLRYTRTGGDKPPVVLAHGFSDSGLCWAPIARALEADYDLIMVDARGHGYSDAPEDGYTLPQMAADLRGVIAKLGLRRPAIIGHSMGGGTTLALAGLFPDVPGAIVIEDAGAISAADFPASRGGEERVARMRAQIAERKQMTREQLIEAEHARSPLWSREELEPWADAQLLHSPRSVAFDPTGGIEWGALLPQIACPALLITADLERGAFVTSAHAAKLQAAVPTLRVAHITGAGHCVRRDQLGSYLAVLRDFLAESMR